MRKYLLFCVFVVLSVSSLSQNLKKEYSKIPREDTATRFAFLTKWEKAAPEDAELYVALFNYYVQKSQSEMLNFKTDSKNGEFKLTDSTGKIIATVSAETVYHPKIFQQGIEAIEKGIRKHPDRLDMRFGKIYMYGETMDYDKFTKGIVDAIHYSAINKNKWTWADNKAVEDPKNFMLGNIQTYIIQLYDAGDEHADRMIAISEAVLKHYPDHVESLSNIAIAYSIKGEQDNALKALLKAETIAPEDFIVLNNIATIYYKKKDTRNAIKYYELVLKHGDEEAKEMATEKLKELRQKNKE